MELKWLEDFVALVQAQSFSRAAEARNITQSGLSRRIRSLEQWVGAELVDRSGYPPALIFRRTQPQTLNVRGSTRTASSASTSCVKQLRERDFPIMAPVRS